MPFFKKNSLTSKSNSSCKWQCAKSFEMNQTNTMIRQVKEEIDTNSMSTQNAIPEKVEAETIPDADLKPKNWPQNTFNWTRHT